MTRSEMEISISRKLQKQKHLFVGYNNGSIDFRCLCDNLAGRVLTAVEEEGMVPAAHCPDPYDHEWELE